MVCSNVTLVDNVMSIYSTKLISMMHASNSTVGIKLHLPTVHQLFTGRFDDEMSSYITMRIQTRKWTLNALRQLWSKPRHVV